MKNSDPRKQEIVADQLIEDISQSEYISLGEGAATCQVCGYSFEESDVVVVCVFRPAGEAVYQFGNMVCGGEQELSGEFTLGVREVVVRGRVGWCCGESMGSSWLVLREPEVVGVSAAATKSIRLLPNEAGEVVFRGDVPREPAVRTVDAGARGDQQ